MMIKAYAARVSLINTGNEDEDDEFYGNTVCKSEWTVLESDINTAKTNIVECDLSGHVCYEIYEFHIAEEYFGRSGKCKLSVPRYEDMKNMKLVEVGQEIMTMSGECEIMNCRYCRDNKPN